MLKPAAWLPVVGCLLVSGYVYDTATGIGPSDVSAYLGFDQEPRHFSASPGDLVAISADGQSLDPLCSMEVEYVERIRIETTYINRLSKTLPSFRSLFAKFLGGGDQEDAISATQRLHFSGSVQSLDDENLPRSFKESCECAVAERLLVGNRVCTVRGALVEQGNDLVRAIRFSGYSVFVGREKVEQCTGRYTKAAEEAARLPCAIGNLPWDAKWRDDLRLIEPELIEPEPAVVEELELTDAR